MLLVLRFPFLEYQTFLFETQIYIHIYITCIIMSTNPFGGSLVKFIFERRVIRKFNLPILFKL